MNIVIIGASFAGVTAALQIKKIHTEAIVTVIDKNKSIGFLPSGINLLLKGETARMTEASAAKEQELTSKGIRLLLDNEVTQLNAKKRFLLYKEKGEKKKLDFDRLILATGSSQLSKRIKGTCSPAVLLYKEPSEQTQMLSVIEAAKEITIVGGGQVGLEAADALLHSGKKIRLIESMGHVLFKQFDQEFADIIQSVMTTQGIELLLGETVNEIKTVKDKDVLSTKAITQKAVYESDSLILGTNVRPNTALAQGEIELNSDGTVKVDAYMRTSNEAILAIGDCVRVPFYPTKEDYYVPLVNNAIRTAVAASFNLNENRLSFKGSLRTIGSKIFGYFIASCGLTKEEAFFYPYETTAVSLKQLIYLDGKETEILGKLIVKKDDRAILGGQFLSTSNILPLADHLAGLIEVGSTADDLAVQDVVFYAPYTPAFSLLNELALTVLSKELFDKED